MKGEDIEVTSHKRVRGRTLPAHIQEKGYIEGLTLTVNELVIQSGVLEIGKNKVGE